MKWGVRKETLSVSLVIEWFMYYLGLIIVTGVILASLYLVFAKWKYLLQVAKPTQNPHHIKLCQKTSDTTNQLLPHKECSC